MKELNDDIDDLFKDSMESEGSEPSDKVWNNLDARLDKGQLLRYKQKVTRLRIFSSSLVVLLLFFTVYEIYFPSHPVVYKDGLPVAENATKQKETVESDREGYKTQATSHQGNEVTLKPGAASPPMAPGMGLLIQKHVPSCSSVAVQVKSSAHKIGVSFVPIAAASPAVKFPGISPMDAPVTSTDNAAGISDKKEIAVDGSEFFRPFPDLLTTVSTDSIISFAGNGGPLTAEELSPISKSRFSIGLFFSPERSGHLLTSDHDADHDTHQDADDDFGKREVPGFSSSAGIKLGYDLNAHWTVFTGLSYLSFSQKISPTTVYPEEIPNGGTHYTLSTSTGDAQLPDLGNKTLSTDSLNLHAFSTQSLHFVSLPVTVQYTYQVKKLKFHFFAGLSLNYLAAQTLLVEMTASNGREQSVKVSNINGVNRFSEGLIAGVGVQYDFCKHFQLSLDPVFKSMITPINYNTEVKSYPFSTGLQFGIGYHF